MEAIAIGNKKPLVCLPDIALGPAGRCVFDAEATTTVSSASCRRSFGPWPTRRFRRTGFGRERTCRFGGDGSVWRACEGASSKLGRQEMSPHFLGQDLGRSGVGKGQEFRSSCQNHQRGRSRWPDIDHPLGVRYASQVLALVGPELNMDCSRRSVMDVVVLRRLKVQKELNPPRQLTAL